jgi:hypothetical protein
VFFGVESLAIFPGFRHLMLGVQSIVVPAQWVGTLRAHRKLREQVRRARAKGVTVRIVDRRELEPGAPLRREVERLRSEWLASRPMEPMAFLVAVEPFHAPAEHLYVAAERQGRLVQFLSAVPIYERQGWLLEDMLRGADAPNGTTELILDLVMRDRHDAAWITPGLTPLAGGVPWWLRLTSVVSRPLYDFDGLRRFRARLSPARWDPVWVVWDRDPAIIVILDLLRAFAEGRLYSFAWRSIVRHPNGPPWAVAVPLVPWTMMLAWLAVSGRAGVLGYSAAALMGWTVFDTILATLLFRAARRPAARTLYGLAIAAACDAIVSVRHLLTWGLGATLISATLRLLATGGPLLGTAALTWAGRRAAALRRPR